MKVVHFGAGNIGRGLIGALLIECNHEVCFVDVDTNRVNQLNKDNYFLLQLLDEDKKINKIAPVCALNGITDTDKVIDAIVDADLITTSVGVNNLNKIASTIVKGLQKRADNEKEKIDIIANENAINASFLLKDEVMKVTTDSNMIDKTASFVNSAIDRQALLENIGNDEVVVVEPYFEWIINKNEIANEKTLSISSATYVDNMEFYITRKLYCVNAPHATIAYVGYIFAKQTIQEALKDEAIKNFTKKTMSELSQYLIKKYHASSEEMSIYMDKTMARFENDNLQDSVLRVGRTPIRKLGSNERLVGPLVKLYNMGLPINHLSKVIAAALYFKNSEDNEAVEIGEFIKQNGVEQAIRKFSQITEEEIIQKIKSDYESINKNKGSFLDL